MRNVKTLKSYHQTDDAPVEHVERAARKADKTLEYPARVPSPWITDDEALAFDDVLLVPNYSQVLPSEASVYTRFSRRIDLRMPLVSAAMDTVTESAMAIAMAQSGGLGVIHKNMSVESQAQEVRLVKKHESGIIVNPLTIHPDQKLRDALQLKERHNISGIPVVDRKQGRLVGILTNRDMRFVDDPTVLVKDVMTKDNLVTAMKPIDSREATRLLHHHRIEKLLVVDESYRCVGLITVKDIEKASAYPDASKDEHGRLRVAAAVGVLGDFQARAEALVEAGVDALVIDSAHGHSRYVRDALKDLRQRHDLDIVVGNIVTAEAARDLIDAGADGIKLGIGPGSICTTRIMAGVGLPQLTAILEVAPSCREHGVPLIADGGIRSSGDIAKALAAGADSIMAGSLFAGTRESPGEIFLHQGRHYKVYRGMGSMAAMKKGGGERYFQGEGRKKSTLQGKWVPEGIEGQVPFRGDIKHVLYQMVGGLKSAMGYLGAADLQALRTQVRFRRISKAALQEGHVHDVTIIREAPNYPSSSS